MLRHFPFLLPHIFLDGNRQRVDGVHFRRGGQQHRFFLVDAVDGADIGNLRHADGKRPGLIEDHGVSLSQRFDVIPALDENAFLRGGGNRGGNRRGGGKLQPTGEIDKEQVQHPLPIPRRAIDDESAKE